MRPGVTPSAGARLRPTHTGNLPWLGRTAARAKARARSGRGKPSLAQAKRARVKARAPGEIPFGYENRSFHAVQAALA